MERKQIDTMAPGYEDRPVLGLLVGQLEDAFSRMADGVGRLSQEELEYRGPDGSLNSVATLVLHTAGVYMQYLYDQFLGREVPPAIRETYGIVDDDAVLPTVTGRTGEELIRLHRQALDRLIAHVSNWTDEDLATPRPFGPRHEATARWALWHCAEHVMLHVGHMIWLLKFHRAGKRA
jgi:hypothetical protein